MTKEQADRLARAEKALMDQLAVLYAASQEETRQHHKLISLWEERDRIEEEIAANDPPGEVQAFGGPKPRPQGI